MHIDIHLPTRLPVGILLRGDADDLLREIMSHLFPSDSMFIGQDATMLRSCIMTTQDRPLDSEPFIDPIEFRELADLDDEGPRPAIQVLKNGSVFANASLVRDADEGPGWWFDDSVG